MSSDAKSKDELSRQIDRARNATASAGKFTGRLKAETEPKNRGKKRKVRRVSFNETVEVCEVTFLLISVCGQRD